MLEICLQDLVKCSCITADDLGATGYGGAIAYTDPHCPLHGECHLTKLHSHVGLRTGHAQDSTKAHLACL